MICSQDFRGQKIAERLFQVIIILFGVRNEMSMYCRYHRLNGYFRVYLADYWLSRRLHDATVQYDHLQCSLRCISFSYCKSIVYWPLQIDRVHCRLLQLTLPPWPMYRNHSIQWQKCQDTNTTKSNASVKSPKKDARKVKAKKDE
jgi:hypothetical protein